MIKDKKLKLIIAENPEERIWFLKKEESERQLKEMEEALKSIPALMKYNKEVIKLCKKKLK